MIALRILRADQIQPAHDAARMLAEAGEKPVGRLVSAAIANVDDSLSTEAIVRAIGESKFDQLWRHLALERLGYALRPALNRLAVIHDRSAIEASLAIPLSPLWGISKARPSRLKTPAVIHLTYDPLNAATVTAQNAANTAIINTVVQTAQATAEQILSDGLSRGVRPEIIARRLRDTLGLSMLEANAIANYRTALQTNPPSALQRGLRDRRYDATITRGDLSTGQIDTLVERYTQRYRSFRALRLARSESLRAANQGRAAAWAQYSALTGRGFRRFWQTAGDELVCPICSAIPGMNPDGVGEGEAYETPIGPLMIPPDPHPNCRCSERFERIYASEDPESDDSSGIGLRVELDYGQ